MSKLPRLLPLIAVAIGGVVAVKATGLAPDLFDGARAWAQEAPAAAAAAPIKAVSPVCALTPAQLAQQAGISPAELRIIQSLSKRRDELDARDADFATTLPLMVAAEQKLDAKLQALNALKAEVATLVGQVGEKEKAEVDRLVAVYSAMRPREAAPIMATLDDSVRLPVAAAMRPRSLAAIMSQMTAPQARELTEKLARRFQAQQLAARAAAAGSASTSTALAATPAAAPTRTAAAAAPTPQPIATPNAAAARPVANRPAATRPAARPAARRPAPTPAVEAPKPPTTPVAETPAAPRPYQAPAASTPAPATPRQSVE